MRRLLGLAVPLGAALFAFGFGAIMILALGASPIEGFSAILDGAFGTGDRLAATAVRAAPLLLVGVGITIAFRANVINIGGEGQIIAGALLSTIVRSPSPEPPKLDPASRSSFSAGSSAVGSGARSRARSRHTHR